MPLPTTTDPQRLDELAGMADAEGWPKTATMLRERAAQLVQLKLASPNRSAARQHDVDGLALFDIARQPRLL